MGRVVMDWEIPAIVAAGTEPWLAGVIGLVSDRRALTRIP